MKISLTCLAVLAFAGSASAQYDFSLKSYGVVDAPQGIASGDLDGDGTPIS